MTAEEATVEIAMETPSPMGALLTAHKVTEPNTKTQIHDWLYDKEQKLKVNGTFSIWYF